MSSNTKISVQSRVDVRIIATLIEHYRGVFQISTSAVIRQALEEYVVHLGKDVPSVDEALSIVKPSHIPMSVAKAVAEENGVVESVVDGDRVAKVVERMQTKKEKQS